MNDNSMNRRLFLQTGFTLGTSLVLGGASSCQKEPTPLEPEESADESPLTTNPTPECAEDDEPTPAVTEGPYFTPNSPERASLLEPGIVGTLLTVGGAVFTADCKPVPGALVDFWHCDADGNYDNVGYRLRGHQYTDKEGRYRLETIVPGIYPGRTRHIHVKVQPPNGRILTSQLFFPGEPGNDRDGIFLPELLMTVTEQNAAKFGAFNFHIG